MDAIEDFEDILALLHKYKVKYLIVGGLAFIFHAKPRYTKDIDLWISPNRENIGAANKALAEFGSPILIDPDDTDQIVQIGIAPNRIDLLLTVPGVRFATAWKNRIHSNYGSSKAAWIDLDSLIRAKKAIDLPRHQEDARILALVRQKRKQ